MTEGWFAGLDPDDADGAAQAVREGSAEAPADWPRLAVEAGYVDTVEEYYERLHAATTRAARAAVRERESAGDRQLAHAVRALDDCERTANELAERVADWGSAPDGEGRIDFARRVAAEPAEGPFGARRRSLAARAVALADEADALRAAIERHAPAVAPNLSDLAGPVLAARLVALAGGLDSLARMPSGTVQVLGAEDALFAHLAGDAPSPKHGVIYVHEAVRGTNPEHRGSAARALAGKLAIAARIDHYAGDRRPELARDLAARIETIQARPTGGDTS